MQKRKPIKKPQPIKVIYPNGVNGPAEAAYEDGSPISPLCGPKLCECGPETSNPPASVSIIGKEYKIQLVERNDFVTLKEGEDGECDRDDQIIKVRIGKSIDYTKDTVIHECIHALEDSFKLKLSERQVETLATGLVALFNDNPELTKFLLKT